MSNLNFSIQLARFKKLAGLLPGLTLALVLFATTINAQVVHTVDPGAITTPTTALAGLDLDQDGMNDIYIGARVIDTITSGIEHYFCAGLIALNAGNAFVGDSQNVGGGFIPRIAKLNLGDTVGPNQHYNNVTLPYPQYLVSVDSLFDTANGTPIQVFSGYFRDTSYHFVGVRFTDGVDTYYGWARVKMEYFSAVKATVRFYDFAFDQTPNTPIIAGDTGAGVIPVFADTASAIIATDVADNGNGFDLGVSFNKAANESTVGSYRLIVVRDSAAANFDFAAADAVPPAYYRTILPTGSNINTTLLGASRDNQGISIQNGVAYRVFVLNIADGNTANINTLSAPSNKITLATVANPVSSDSASVIVASDVANNENGSDLQVTFNKAAQENTIGTYRIIVAKATSNLTLSLANGVAAGNYTVVTPNGANVTQVLSATAKDADGAAIAENVIYKVYVLNIADGTNANVNTLSGPSDTVTLSHPVGISNVQPLENVNVYSTNNTVYVSFTNADATTGIVTIYSAAGQQVYANQVTGNQAIALTNAAAGVYTVKVLQNGKILTKQVFLSK